MSRASPPEGFVPSTKLACWDRPENLHRYIRSALARNLPELAPADVHGETMTLVGSAPSLADHWQKIEPGHVFAVNFAHDWLLEKGSRPDALIHCDSRGIIQPRFTPQKGTKYLLASQSHPDMFDCLKSHDVALWHVRVPAESTGEDIRDIVARHGTPGRKWFVPSCGTAMLTAFHIGKMWGYRSFRVFGLDSSFQGDQHHVDNNNIVAPGRVTASYAGRSFETNAQFASQAAIFEKMYMGALSDCRIEVIGDGLIPWICENLNRLKYGAETWNSAKTAPAT